MTVFDIPERTGPVSHARGPRVQLSWLISPGGLAAVYLLALAVAETIIALSNPLIGLGQHAILLLILLLQAALNWDRPERDLLLSLILAPLIRLLSLSMPLASFPLIYWYPIISCPLLLAIWLLARTLNLSREALGLHLQHLPQQFLVALSGLVFGCVEYLILRPEPLVAGFTGKQFWIPALILLVCTGLIEELIFRGVMQRGAERTLGRFGLFYVSLISTALHIGHRSVLNLLFVLLVALFFGWVVAKTGSLLGVTLSHGLINITLFLLAPFLLGPPAELPSAATTPVLAISTTPTANQAVIMATPTEIPLARPSPGSSAMPSRESMSAIGETSTLVPTATFTPLPARTISVHLVEAGENLYQISLIYGVDWQRLAARNGLTGAGAIRAGQALEIPEAGAGPAPIPGDPPMLPTTHRERPGENLYRIGLIYAIPWTVLATANDLPDGDILYSGQILVIPNYRPHPVQPEE
jgi:membrane protease YdiL (CAAX protease family)/LysM repeat protein